MIVTCIIYTTLIALTLCAETHAKRAALVMLLSHTAKDLACPECAWPVWTDVAAIVFGCVFVRSRTAFARAVGGIVVCGHARNLIFRGNRFYT